MIDSYTLQLLISTIQAIAGNDPDFLAALDVFLTNVELDAGTIAEAA